MATMQRFTYFRDEMTDKESRLNMEFDNIVNSWNNMDAGVVALTSPKFAAATLAGNLAMGNHKLTGLAAGTGTGDSLRYEQLIGLYLLLTGGTMSGAIAMGTNKITGLAAGTTGGDALRYEQLINLYLLLTGGTMSGAIAMGANKITGLANGSAASDAAAFGQVPVITAGQVVGTATNDNASAGNVAEEITTTVGATTVGTSAQWSDLASLALTAGDWNAYMQILAIPNGAAVTGSVIGIGTVSGNNQPGSGSQPFDLISIPNPAAGTMPNVAAFFRKRISLTGPATVYAKGQFTYTVATPKSLITFWAERRR